MADIIVSAQADVIVLQGVDYDYGQAAITGLAALIAEKGVDYSYRFALRPNTGMQTGLDMDGNGSVGEPRDAQGYGRFSGQGGMAILSRFPVLLGDVRDFSDLRWRDLPGAQLPMVDGAPFPSAEVHEVQRLSSTGHWDVPLVLPDNELLHIWTFHATPPVFDGPEDRNGKRNHDEIAFWMRYLEGAFGPIPRQTFVIAGVTNLDPVDGEGLHQVMRDLLSHPDIQDPEPRSAGALQASDPDHMGDPALDTADFGDIGSLRVSYLLPSVQWDILDQGVLWPEAEADAEASGRRHHLVWVDIAPKSED